MRNLKEVENLSVRAHAINAARRNGSTGELSEMENFHEGASEPLPAQQWWWQKYFKWETLTVAGKVIEKGFVVSPFLMGLVTTAVGVLLAAVLTIAGTVYWRLSDRIDKQREEAQVSGRENRDLLIRLDQKLTDKAIHDQEKIEDIQKRFQNTDALQTVIGRDLIALKMKAGIK